MLGQGQSCGVCGGVGDVLIYDGWDPVRKRRKETCPACGGCGDSAAYRAELKLRPPPGPDSPFGVPFDFEGTAVYVEGD